jgi:hypothetical protein
MTDKIAQALAAAVADPSKRKAFYQALLGAHVYVLVETSGPSLVEVDGFLERETVPFVIWEQEDGAPVIPFFSSESLLHAVAGDHAYQKFPALTFFELTHGSLAILNPRTDQPKVFFAEEIEYILSGKFQDEQ